jgi:hypothetical protein
MLALKVLRAMSVLKVRRVLRDRRETSVLRVR